MEKRIISSSLGQLPKGGGEAKNLEGNDPLPTEVWMQFLNGLPLSGPRSRAGFISGEVGKVGEG